MLVSAALSAHVSNQVRQKGADYFRGRAVSGLSFEGGVLSAVVKGAATPFPLREMVFVVDVAASKAAGALVVETMLRSKKANGDWTRPKAHRLTPSTMPNCPTPT